VIPFDPERGTVIVPAPGDGPGSWAGAPGACRDGADLFVAYRLRRPPPLRGYELRIAAVRDGRAVDLWRAGKDDLGALSIERSALVRWRDRWRLYVSYVDGGDRRWRIGLLEAPRIDSFDARDVRAVLHPDDIGMSAVKDPWLRQVDGGWLMFVSCGRGSAAPGLHESGDALSTGIVRSETGLATSDDGVYWRWEGVVFSPSKTSWDRATARLTTAVRDADGWLGCYDGAGSVAENYEERCGLARSTDLRKWTRVSHGGPAIGTRTGPGGVRYTDVTEGGDTFYEHTRADGAHELRLLQREGTPAVRPL
jgi:hypothetical protein